jgi:hypothetical protein
MAYVACFMLGVLVTVGIEYGLFRHATHDDDISRD